MSTQMLCSMPRERKVHRFEVLKGRVPFVSTVAMQVMPARLHQDWRLSSTMPAARLIVNIKMK
eukprot:scaffold340399_cov14-Prasinocladus_malaysianus.AAC.1